MRGSLGPVIRRFVAALACAILGPAAGAAGGSGEPGSDPAAPAATVHVIEPERPYLRRRAAWLSDELRTPDDRSKPWLEWEHASGDWGGLRPRLQEAGVIAEVDFTGQLFSKVRGGLDPGNATHAAGLVSVSLTLDTGRLGLWPGGTILVAAEHQNGSGVSREVGSTSDIGTLDGSPRHFTQLAALTLQQNLFDDRLVARIGKSDANVGFLDSELASLYLNGDFEPPGNIPMPTYPDPAFGLALFADPAPWLTLAAAAYGADLGVQENGGDGLFRGRAFAIAELTLHFEPFGLPGHYNAGAWMRSFETPDPAKPPGGRSFPRNYGAYALIEQQLTRESPRTPSQGLGAWFQLSWAPPDRNPIDLWVGGGLVYTGLVPGRDRDQIGVGVANVGLVAGPQTSGDPPPEIVVECFYAIQLAPWLALQPDLQVIVDPAAGGRDALVIGAQLSIGL